MTEFQIKLPSLKAQQIEEVKKASLVLDDKYIIYELDFTASNMVNAEDEALGWTDPERSYLFSFMLKEYVSGVEINLIDNNTYMMLIMGRDATIKLFFEQEDLTYAKEILTKIQEWLFS